MNIQQIWQDKDGQVVLGQWPNIWIIIWAAMALLRLVKLPQDLAHFTRFIGTGSLIIWALLEIFQGANYFRRGLGLIVLVVTTISAFRIGL